MINADMTVNEIVEAAPSALRIFTNIGIDTCCGGALPLKEVAVRHALDLDELLRALNVGTQTSCTIPMA